MYLISKNNWQSSNIKQKYIQAYTYYVYHSTCQACQKFLNKALVVLKTYLNVFETMLSKFYFSYCIQKKIVNPYCII